MTDKTKFPPALVRIPRRGHAARPPEHELSLSWKPEQPGAVQLELGTPTGKTTIPVEFEEVPAFIRGLLYLSHINARVREELLCAAGAIGWEETRHLGYDAANQENPPEAA